MPRRETQNITGIKGTGSVNPSTVWRVFECGRPGCSQLLKVSEDELEARGPQIVLPCPGCGFENNVAIISHGARWKYCRVCECLKPLEAFDRHAPTSRGFRSGRQLECKACKKLINAVLNPLRTRDQHREASERRRLHGLLAGDRKLNEKDTYKRFGNKCFNCGTQLGFGEGIVDHTLPAKLLWPLGRGPTLLCRDCNGAKAEQWPSEFYKRDAVNVDVEKLRRLSVLTGIPYELLAGPPRLNPDAVGRLTSNMDEFLVRWIRYPDEIKRIRKVIKDMEGLDIFDYATTVPPFLREEGEV